MQKEIVVFTEGDSSDSSVWSNIPYFLTKTLEEKGYKVHRINVEGPVFFIFLYNKIFRRILKLFFSRNTTYSYNRSKLCAYYISHKMKNSLKKYPNFYCTISTSFSFAPSQYTQKPTILICDWTYDYYLTHFNHKEPDFFERLAVQRQDLLIESADFVYSLFPDVAKYMQEYYANPNIAYLGNVINSDPINAEVDFRKKHLNHKILFIGLKKYLDGALALIESVIELHHVYPDIELSIIGMNAADCYHSDYPSYIHFHGYLSKNNPSQKELYYSLLHDSTVYINTTPLWAGFSSALESLYHYLPVITSPYSSFLDTFGQDINFGYYCSENKPDRIANIIRKILDMPTETYEILCRNAHECTLDYTWSSYVNKMLKKINL